MRRRLLLRAALAATLLLTPACGSPATEQGAAPPSTRSLPPPFEAPPPTSAGPAAGGEPVLLAAGDIASCGSSGDEATAALIAARPAAVVATLGDNVYERGTAAEFAGCYAPSWGVHRERTRPSPGNHDYSTANASGYFDYFGTAAGERGKGYYSYDLGSWHIIVLNSNCSVVPCTRGSAQEQWLRDDLAASAGRACTLAYWHHPRFSSGTRHGSSATTAAFWRALYEAGADVVLVGHEHNYERFAPLDPSGALDPARGIRSFVVGTGGRSHYGLGRPIPGSEVRHHGTFGVLELTLRTGAFDWRFVPEAGATFTDAGSATCH